MTDRIDEIEQELEALGYIAILWHADDVKEERPDLSDAQCREVLRLHKQRHDASIGISWDSICAFADALYPELGCPAGEGERP